TKQVNGFNITNTYTPEIVEVSGSKSWEDSNNQDGKRPSEIIIRLLANGVEKDSKTVTEADGWAWTFTGLPKYEAGQEISYKITEDAVTDYTSTVNGHDVTNSYTPGKTQVQVTKAWEDANNQDGVRPETINVKLLKNGLETGQKLILSEANNWSGSFTDLDEYENGTKISYSVKEVEVGNGYASEVTVDQVKGYTITNRRSPE
ncbi:Cna B-type domain-containing protein, partial [Histophilus somni]|uniref:Cna B-type domain-containing protein n=1 Tax=Histophilus somni TaxID=731 RepID=UPI00201ED437